MSQAQTQDERKLALRGEEALRVAATDAGVRYQNMSAHAGDLTEYLFEVVVSQMVLQKPRAPMAVGHRGTTLTRLATQLKVDFRLAYPHGNEGFRELGYADFLADLVEARSLALGEVELG